jgi:hypothetical protein
MRWTFFMPLMAALFWPGAEAFSSNGNSSADDDAEVAVLYERRFNAENFEQLKKPAPIKTWWSDFSSTFVGATVAIQNGAHHTYRKLQELKNGDPDGSEEAYRRNLLAGDFDATYESKINAGALGQLFSEQYQAEFTKRYWSDLDFFKNFQQGLDFSVGGEEQPAKEMPQLPLRYGLILEDVREPENLTLHASLGSDDMGEWQMAARAQPVWTIGPIDEDDMEMRRADIPVYVIRHDDATKTPRLEYLGVINGSQRAERKLEDRDIYTFLKSISYPSHEFRTRVRPRGMPSPSQLSAREMPGVEVQLTQVQNFYSMSYFTVNGVEKERVEHRVWVPITGKLAIHRKFDEDFNALETQIDNILVLEGMPSLCLNRNDVTGDIKTILRIEKNAHTIALSAETPAGRKLYDNHLRSEAEKYEISYRWHF